MLIKTFRYRVKNPKRLDDLARAVNFVWNYCGDVQEQARRRRVRWLTHFDFNRLVAGNGALPARVTSAVTQYFVTARNKAKRRPRWRASYGKRRALGWIPFAAAGACVKFIGSTVRFAGATYPLWMDRPPKGRMLCGSFAEDSRGRWFLNVTCEVEVETRAGTAVVGVDLGLKELAAMSDGMKLENPRHYRALEDKLATAQRARRRARVTALHAKIAARRKHDLHVASRGLVDRCAEIYLGDVNASALGQTRMAKSVYDAGWSMFRNMVRYKGEHAGIIVRDVDERCSTQTCSSCGARSGPRGVAGLSEREWTCSSCGAAHDRDVNAARNILNAGRSVGLQAARNPS